MKKILAIISAVILLCAVVTSTLFSAYAYTCVDFEYTRSGSNATIIAYNGSADVLSVPSSLDGYAVVAMDDGVFQNNTALVSVTVPDSVTKIGAKCFYSCPNLKTVNLPDGVETVGRGAFAACEQLTKVTLPNSLVDKFVDDGYGYIEQITGLMPRAFSMPFGRISPIL